MLQYEEQKKKVFWDVVREPTCSSALTWHSVDGPQRSQHANRPHC